MLLISLLCIRAFSQFHKFSNFLQEETTSISTLAEGLETFNEDFSEFSYNLDKTISDIELQLETLNSVNEQVAITLLDLDISQLNNDLEDVNQAISEIESILLESDECTILSSCGGCVENLKCVWCVDTLECSKGDDDGPLSGTCNDYSFSICGSENCQNHLSCTICLSSEGCGWCENGGYCLEGTADDSGTCGDSFYYHIEAGGRDVCPEINNIEEEDEENDSSDNNDPFASLQNELDGLEIQAIEIELLIEELKLDKEEITLAAALSVNLDLPSIGIDSSIDGLVQEVEDLAVQEIEDEQEFQEELADSTANTIVDETTETIENNLEDVEAVVEESSEEVSELIEAIDNNLSGQVEEINVTIDQIQSIFVSETEEETDETEETDEVSMVIESTEEEVEEEEEETDDDIEDFTIEEDTESTSFLSLDR